MPQDTTNNEIKSEKSAVAHKEEQILKFWLDNQIFEKSIQKNEGNGKEYTFYDGPPFATGVPHYGHILAGTLKDVMPRYQTMKGKLVRRRWGWDCHGLPIENIVEKEFGLKSKKDIEEFGIEQFNLRARAQVFTYADEWKKQVPRLGRWVDMDNDYKTMDASYTESVWWVFKTLFDKGLAYEGYKSMHICPRCETTLSNFEVGQGYKDINDISVTAEFELINSATENFSQVLGNNPQTMEKTSVGSVYVLAWTTTPWTLPGNVALAVNPGIDYVEVSGEVEGNKYVVAKSRVEAVFKENYKILREFKGSELIGKSYKPVFDYFQNKPLKDFQGKVLTEDTGWKIYGADFVTTEDGTGIVHIAPAFGEDDMNLGKEKHLPFVQHVSMDGRFTAEITDWAGELVKPKDDHSKADVEVLKNLAARGLLFAKEKYTHSYPHCWRCQTPLLNYATNSWFIDVPKVREELVKVNKGINWVPEHIKEGRFGNWLEGAREWAISRQRYWGAPLPVWKCEACKEVKVFGSIEELKTAIKRSGNKYLLMRHGESDGNLNDLISCNVADDNHLTEKGRDEVKKTAEELKDKKIDFIFASDFVRTKETADILAAELGLKSEQIIFDQRLREWNVGKVNGGKWADYDKTYPSKHDKLEKIPDGGESVREVKKRLGDIAYELENKYQGKNIVLISHGLPLFFLRAAMESLSADQEMKMHNWGSSWHTAEVKEVEFAPLPHNENFELDLHRPYIDWVTFGCDCGGEVKRIPDLFDCWFESGSMPYGQAHYPFENKDIFDPEKGIGFPADFIAEGLDQTRGWFYSMLVLSTALFGQTSFKNVIVNGTSLTETGEKMSKSLRNYPDPMIVVDKYGADALRFYLLSSPIVRAEDLCFSEKGLSELYRRVIMRLTNVVTFFETYVSDIDKSKVLSARPESKNILDQWVLARLSELVAGVEKNLDAYELDRAARQIDDFIDDLSNWYLRRSRDRFKTGDADQEAAINTTYFVLKELSKVMAPFTPFIAEEIYLKLKQENEPESVHLCDFPHAEEFDVKLIEDMMAARKLVELGLAARMSANIKVRQPLATLKIKTAVPEFYLSVIADELNVKKVEVDRTIEGEVWLDTELSPELIKEGQIRDLIRNIQELRKKEGLNPGEPVVVELSGTEEVKQLINQYLEEIKKSVSASSVEWTADGGEKMKLGDLELIARLRR
ncbi:MAG: class I tRNA ligase family protein [bacterium]